MVEIKVHRQQTGKPRIKYCNQWVWTMEKRIIFLKIIIIIIIRENWRKDLQKLAFEGVEIKIGVFLTFK